MYFLLFFRPQEWEEKLNRANETAETYKQKYQSLKESGTASSRGSHSVASGGGESSYLEQAKSFASRLNEDDSSAANFSSVYGSVRSVASGVAPKAETVASLSGLAAQARTIVMNTNFNCAAPRGGAAGDDDDSAAALREMARRYEASPVTVPRPTARGGGSGSGPRSGPQPQRQQDRSRSRSKNSRSFREYSRSPQRVDV